MFALHGLFPTGDNYRLVINFFRNNFFNTFVVDSQQDIIFFERADYPFQRQRLFLFLRRNDVKISLRFIFTQFNLQGETGGFKICQKIKLTTGPLINFLQLFRNVIHIHQMQFRLDVVHICGFRTYQLLRYTQQDFTVSNRYFV